MTQTIEQHLIDLHTTSRSPQAQYVYLMNLKNSGFEPNVVYDIGCCVLEFTKTIMEIWPNTTVVLFDAFDKAEFLYKQTGLAYHLGVLSDTDGKQVKFYQHDTIPFGNSYYREIGSPSNIFPPDSYKMYTTYRLDSVVKDRGFPLPDLVKIDVQGSERDVIQGGMETLGHATHLIVEMQHMEYNEGAPLVGETLPWIESNGWTCTSPSFSKNYADSDFGFVRTSSLH